MFIGGEKVLVFGFGKSGKAVVNLLLSYNVKIIFFGEDFLSESDKVKYLNQGVTIKEKVLDGINISEINLLIKSPGIQPNNKILKKFKKSKINIITDIELTFLLRPNLEYIAVTGSNGKTTTTTLIGELLNDGKRSVYVCGNIGTPICEVAKIANNNDIIVVELSSFQLEYAKTFKPNITVISNVGTAHIDFHGSVEQYYHDKFSFLNNLDELNYLIMHENDYDNVSKFLNGTNIHLINNNLNGNWIKYDSKELVEKKEYKLVGGHNYKNLLLALKVCEKYGVDRNHVKEVVKSFNGVEYRLEYLGEINGVKVYNDAKSTNPESLITALKSIENNVVLIVGGYDRGDDYSCIEKHLEAVVKIIGYGETSNKLQKVADNNNIKFNKCKDLTEAFTTALSNANFGMTILYSPGAASYDQFKSYNERGTLFTELYNLYNQNN